MRHTLLSFLILLIGISCQDKSHLEPEDQLTELSLYFTDFDSDLHKSFVEVKIQNGIDPIIEQLKISDDGRASYYFRNEQNREIVLNYEENEFSLILSPGEKAEVRLQVANLNTMSNYRDFEVVSDVNELTNNYILDYTNYLDSLVATAPSPFSSPKEKNELSYKEKRLSAMIDQLAVLDSVLKNDGIEDEGFINWSRARVRYQAGYDLSLYPFMGTTNRELSADSDYFLFAQEVNKNFSNLIDYHSYLNYLSLRSSSFRIMSNVSDKYEEERMQLKKDSLSNFPIAFSLAKKLPKNRENELIMGYLFLNNKKVPEHYKDSIPRYITTEEILSQLLTSQENKQLNILALLNDYEITDAEKLVLTELYENAKGKVIYHDFWFTNCSPCMMELPHYNKLMSTMDKDKVEFVFLGAYMDEKEWKEEISRLGLKGQHLLLTKDQLAFYEKYFKVHGFPHHRIIKPNGEIGEKISYLAIPKNHVYIKEKVNGYVN